MGDRCTGHCCRCFTLPVSPTELDAAYKAWFNKDETYDGVNPADIHLLRPMVSHLGLFEKAPVGGEQLEEPAHYYSCKLLDESGNCSIYEIRPALCRDYPYGKACNYAGCTWDDAEAATKEVRDG